MNNELHSKLVSLGQHLTNLGWEPDDAISQVFDLDDRPPEETSLEKAKAFFVQVHAELKSKICIDGKPKDQVITTSSLLLACKDVILTLTQLEIEAQFVLDVLVQIGLDEFCKS
ncbi:hypothetical protein [Pseudaestuariivita rosea]|uniref:hypothetical protein n=1 Tax=Pseudaestuariivita rosea TaxID=2763263 RepID=UPI001ABB1E6F|nr:hypothetical protein [Pseudaestuariivita rosea]